ncbi:MAG: HPr kinase/phosphorylase [Treponema sp.]|nr:HPr kinase/phosphorylase [Treponema sp.]MBR1714260.1 HPr kinase/phosphorylase [Treponema sp.]
MADKSFTVLDLLDMELPGRNSLNLKCIGGRKGLSKQILVPDINRPGLALTGFFDAFQSSRVQLFGLGEVAYLKKLESESRTDTIDKMFSFDIPCVVFTHNLSPRDVSGEFMRIAEEAECAVLLSDLETTEFSMRLMRVFSNIFAPKKTMHGVMVEVYGIGILLTGHSGVGKSECALELIERGHRLVADDIVEMRCVNGNSVLAQGANSLISHHMEIRGLGIINVSQLYGIGSIREQKEVQLVIKLAEWDSAKIYDRIGTNSDTIDILGVKVPMIEVPVKPGRNVPIIIEAAAMNERLKNKGYDSARDFNQNILKWIETGEARSAYYGSDDSY